VPLRTSEGGVKVISTKQPGAQITKLDTASGEKGHGGQIEFYEKEH